MCIRESLWLRNRGRQRVPACDNNANGSDMSKIRRSIDNRQLLSHGMGYVRYMWFNRAGRRTNDLVRHCNSDDCLHCQLTGEGTIMRFGVHFLNHVFMIHIRFELKGKVGRKRWHFSERKIDATWNKRSRQNGAQLVKRTRTGLITSSFPSENTTSKGHFHQRWDFLEKTTRL